MGFEPALPGIWGYETSAQKDARIKLPKTPLSVVAYLSKYALNY